MLYFKLISIYLHCFVNNVYCIDEQWFHLVFVDILDPGCYELTKTSTTPAEVTESTKNQVTHTPTYKETTAVAGNVLSDVSSTGSDR